jgi:o-succinylbenzoate---CoA ligase
MIEKWLEQAAGQHPERLAIRVLGHSNSLSWSAVEERVVRGAATRSAAGVQRGELLVLTLDRTIESVLDLFAVLLLRAVPVLGGALPADSVRVPEGTVLVVYTSGSTGKPKPVFLSQTQIEASVLGSAQRLGVEPSDAWLCALPLSHVGGLSILLRALAAGTSVVLAPGSFQAQALVEALQAGKVSQVSLVPTQLKRMMPFFEQAPPSPFLRFVLLGGAAADQALLADCERLGLPVARTWGMTECASQVATAKPGVFAGPLPPLPGVRVLRDTESGCLRVLGAIAPGGSFLTRDTGQVCEQGVVIEDRVDNIVISGGENLSLDRIRLAVVLHPEIADAAVLSRPDSQWGERPVAFCVAMNRVPPTLESIREFLASAGLREREFPDEIQWVDCLPRTELGKLIKSDLHWK